MLRFRVINYIHQTIRGCLDVDWLLVARVVAKYTIGIVVCHPLSDMHTKPVEGVVVKCIREPKTTLVIINLQVET